MEVRTITGKPATLPASTRLPIPEYEAVRRQAQRNGVSMSILLARWINERLELEGGRRCDKAA